MASLKRRKNHNRRSVDELTQQCTESINITNIKDETTSGQIESNVYGSRNATTSCSSRCPRIDLEGKQCSITPSTTIASSSVSPCLEKNDAASRKRKHISKTTDERIDGSKPQSNGSAKKTINNGEQTSSDGFGCLRKKKKKKKKSRRSKDGSNLYDDGLHESTKKSNNPNRAQLPTESPCIEPVDPEFPFPVQPDDHCESPATAYNDILPLLQKLNSIRYSTNSTDTCNNNKTNYKLHIYDPYYCDGAVERNLNQIGFTNVYHQKEDCYNVWYDLVSSNRYPNQCDVLITNPPYSGDHIEKLIEHVISSKSTFNHTRKDRAWFLLLPTWVHKKEYYIKSVSNAQIQPFYLVPYKRYVYIPPTNFRSPKKSDVHKKSSPFTSMWYCYGGTGPITEQLIRHYLTISKSSSMCDLARSRSALRDLRRKGSSSK